MESHFPIGDLRKEKNLRSPLSRDDLSEGKKRALETEDY